MLGLVFGMGFVIMALKGVSHVGFHNALHLGILPG